MTHRPSFWYGTREEVITLLRAWAAEHGRSPKRSDWPRNENGRPGHAAVSRLFSGWSCALDAAGLPQPGAPGQSRVRRGAPRYWTDARIIAAMQAWAVAHGQAPTAQQWTQAEANRPCAATVLLRFGSWRQALAAAGLQPRPRERQEW